LFLVKNLGKKYHSNSGDKWALRNVSFALPNNGLVAIKGESGSGKSTLLNLLGTLEEPSEGSVFFNGKDLKKLSKKETENLRNFHFGFLFQHFNLLEEQTALENVTLPLLIRGYEKKEATERAQALFQRFGITQLEAKKCHCLSGGEKQRVALLRVLIGEPSVILADEPTGALDKTNENLVMGELKELSKTRLVIVVSHNERLIKTYGERVIAIESGKVISDSDPWTTSLPYDIPPSKRKSHESWIKPLLRAHLEGNLGKNLLSFFSGALGFTSLLLTGAFLNGSEESLQKEKKRSLLYYQASLSERITYPLKDSPLKLSKNERPSLETARQAFADFPDISIENDYSYFLPTYSTYFLNGEPCDPVSFNPVFDVTLEELGGDLVVEGNAPDSNDFGTCLINKEMADAFSFSVVGKTITVPRSLTVTKGVASDLVSFTPSFVIAGVVKELSFLNAPRVYYSYPAERSFFQAYSLPEISEAFGNDFTIDSLLSEALGDEPIASFSFLCFAHSETEASGLRSVQERLAKNESTCCLSNSSYEIEKGFTSLRSAIGTSFVPFLVVEALTLSFIIGALAYSTFLEKRKEAAILSALGAKHGDVTSLFLAESTIVTICGGLFSLLLLPLLEKLLNPILLARTGLPNLLSLPLLSFLGIPFLIPAVLLLVAISLSFLGAGLPLGIMAKRPLAESLRDE